MTAATNFAAQVVLPASPAVRADGAGFTYADPGARPPRSAAWPRCIALKGATLPSPDPTPWPRGRDGPPQTPDHVVIPGAVWDLEFAVDAAAPALPAAHDDADDEPDDAPARGGGGTSIIDDILGAIIDVESFFGRW